ncbi:MAG: CheR family methyltransferase [Planctomycetota bacterium]
MPLLGEIRDLTREEYDLFRRLVYQKSGINLGDQKMQLVRARLGKRVRAGGFNSYHSYYEYVRDDSSGDELACLIDAISTNTTHLFREKQHFKFMASVLRDWSRDSQWRLQNRNVRIWSAACSSGEEPYSIAMTAHGTLSSQPGLELKILATDISNTMLEQARAGVYETRHLGTVPVKFRQDYFTPVHSATRPTMRVKPCLRRLITFEHFNLMSERFPFRHGFNIIFCRNVMIYFDRATQAVLVEKLVKQLRPEGFLLIGHSESLNSVQHPLKYIQPAIYQRLN